MNVNGKKVQKRNGFTMVELLVSIGMVAMLALGTAAIANYSRDSASQTETLSTVLSLRSTMMSVIENPVAWKATLAADSSLSCVKEDSTCYTGEKKLKLHDDQGNLFYDGNSSSRGFNTKAQPCQTYSAQTSTDCVYHYDLTWEPICEEGSEAGACKDSNNLVRVAAKLQVASTANRGNKISNDSYSLNVIKGQATNSIEKTCSAVGGIFSAANKSCVASLTASQRCSPGTVVTSIKANGSLTCGTPFVDPCPPEQVLIGRAHDGSPKCQTTKSRKIATETKDEPVVIQGFECKSFVSLPLTDPLEIPARSQRDGVCYSVKLFDAVPNSPSQNTFGFDKEILSRNHDIASWDYTKMRNPYIMGSAVIKILTHDNRFVKLSGAPSKVAQIKVDNFVVVGTYPHADKDSPEPDAYKAYGTSDSSINDKGDLGFRDGLLHIKAFGASGTSTINALDITNSIKPFVLYDLDVRVLDCGGVRELSPIYLLFQ